MYFTLKYVVSCLCINDIDLGFLIPVDYIHTRDVNDAQI